MTDEKWIKIKRYGGLYSVSNLGNVRRNCGRTGIPKIKMLKTARLPSGYERVFLCKRGMVKTVYVHRLVVSVFIGRIPKNEEVNHKNCRKSDNRLVNLEIVSSKRNKEHARENGVLIRGKKHYAAKTNEKTVIKIRREFVPYKITVKKLAKKYGLKPRMTTAIIRRENWKHV